jgi:hypothetical protein
VALGFIQDFQIDFDVACSFEPLFGTIVA